jgi:hypothetical protein
MRGLPMLAFIELAYCAVFTRKVENYQEDLAPLSGCPEMVDPDDLAQNYTEEARRRFLLSWWRDSRRRARAMRIRRWTLEGETCHAVWFDEIDNPMNPGLPSWYYEEPSPFTGPAASWFDEDPS